MYKNERAAAKEFNKNLEHLENRVFSWGIRKYKLDKTFKKNHGNYMDQFDGFPENYQSMMVASWMFSRVILDPVLLEKFSRNDKESLFPIHNEYLKLWKENPPIWSLFSILEKKDDDIFQVKDDLTGTIMLLQSRSLASMEMNKPIISALIPLKEGFWVSYGVLHQYKSCQPYHLLDLMKFMDYQLYEDEDLTSFIHQYYGRFFQIDHTMESPPIYNKKDLIERNRTEIILPGFDPEALSDSVLLTRKGDIFQIKPLGEERFPFNEIYYNSITEEAIFLSMTLNGYRELCEIISEYELPEEPDFIFSMALYSSMDTYMNLDFPENSLKELFSTEKKESTPEMDETMKKINIFLQESVEADNKGVSYNLQKRGKELGFDSETIQSVKEMMLRIKDKLSE